MVGGGLRAQQVRVSRLLQGHGAEDAEAHPDGRDGLDGVRAHHQEYGTQIAEERARCLLFHLKKKYRGRERDAPYFEIFFLFLLESGETKELFVYCIFYIEKKELLYRTGYVFICFYWGNDIVLSCRAMQYCMHVIYLLFVVVLFYHIIIYCVI